MCEGDDVVVLSSAEWLAMPRNVSSRRDPRRCAALAVSAKPSSSPCPVGDFSP